MSLAANLDAGKHAILHCKQKYTLGASNKPEEAELARQDRGVDIAAETSTQRANYGKQIGPNQTWFDKVATVAESSGMGHCAEQAISAFEYIRWNHEALHCAVLQPDPKHRRWNKMWNHSFAVIGVPGFKRGQQVKLEREQAPADWPTDAVVCDPWLGASGKCFQASDTTEWKTWTDAFTRVTASPGNYDWYFVDDTF